MRQKIIFKSTFIFILLQNRQLASFSIILSLSSNKKTKAAAIWINLSSDEKIRNICVFLQNYQHYKCAKCKTFVPLLGAEEEAEVVEEAIIRRRKNSAGPNPFRSATKNNSRVEGKER